MAERFASHNTQTTTSTYDGFHGTTTTTTATAAVSNSNSNSNNCSSSMCGESISRIVMATITPDGDNKHQNDSDAVRSAHRCQSLLHSFDEIISDTDNIPEFLVAHKTTLRFPEMLLFLLVQAEREAAKSGRHPTNKACIGWALNGQAIIIRNREELVSKLLPMAFPKSKFSSFTRKLYRWGFRQLGIGNNRSKKQNETPSSADACEKTFFHPLFQRDNKALAANMTSTTSEGVRRANNMTLRNSPIIKETESTSPSSVQLITASDQQPHIARQVSDQDGHLQYPKPAFSAVAAILPQVMIPLEQYRTASLPSSFWLHQTTSLANINNGLIVGGGNYYDQPLLLLTRQRLADFQTSVLPSPFTSMPVMMLQQANILPSAMNYDVPEIIPHSNNNNNNNNKLESQQQSFFCW